MSKKIHYLCEDGIEKSVPRITDCHHAASLVMPIGDPRDGFFYPTLILMIDTYNLEKYLPDPDGTVDEYQKPKTKLNAYFLPRRHKYFVRYLFLKMRPRTGERTLYVKRLREQAVGCEFGDNYEE